MDLDRALREVEKKIESGDYSNFWRLVARVKKDSALIERYADRIGETDQKIFRGRVPFTLGIGAGNFIEVVGLGVGAAVLIGGSRYLGAYGWASPIIAALLFSITLHPLAHYLVGRLVGIRFTFYFLDGPIKIEPTLKIDYATYLRASPGKRALMHLSGAFATTTSPLLVLLIAFFLGAPKLSLVALAALFLFFLSTELIPVVLAKLGSPKVLGLDFKKSDSYRAMREITFLKEK